MTTLCYIKLLWCSSQLVENTSAGFFVLNTSQNSKCQ